MDIIDNLIYATYLSGLRPAAAAVLAPPAAPMANNMVFPGVRISSDVVDGFPALPVPAPANPNYATGDKFAFCSYEDSRAIEQAVVRHWYDIDNQFTYTTQGVVRPGGVVAPGTTLVSFVDSSSYHLIYAYLLENTRIIQIFERLLEQYMTDERHGIAVNQNVVAWLQNAERMFFKSNSQIGSDIISSLRPHSEATRRNAYWRMFGMDLAFGNLNAEGNPATYVRASYSNQEFIPLFERYIGEIWQGHINARNIVGKNTADVNIIVELAIQLRELLHARRGNTGTTSYAYLNLSREEYYSVLMTSWFTFILTYDSPLVQFLNCQSSTIGERLMKVGAKVGVPAHGKCQALFEMAGAASSILDAIEVGGILDNAVQVRMVLQSLTPQPLPAPQPTPVHINFMNQFLTVINNWEKATGHNIKNPEANIRGTVRVQQNGAARTAALTPN